MQEAHRRIKGRATPHLDTEKIGQAVRDGAGRGEQVACADARGHQRLMRVAESRIGNEQAFFFTCPFGEFPGSEFLQELAGAGLRFAGGRHEDDRCFQFFGCRLPFYFGIAV